MAEIIIPTIALAALAYLLACDYRNFAAAKAERVERLRSFVGRK
jgi:hypothetical protein